MSDLTINVERDSEHESFLVHPVGLLTKRNRHQLRAAVLKCLADCPVAIVVDLADLELVDRVAAAVFLALRREAAVGPGINILLSGARDTLATRIRSLDPSQPIYPTRAEAIEAIHDGPFVAGGIYRRLPPEPESASLAGCLIADACAAWQLPKLIYPARAVMFDLIRAVCRCPADELKIIAAQRPDHLLLSVRSRVTAGHRPDCVAGHRPRQQITRPGVLAGPGAATYHHRVTATGHIGWASLSTPAG